MLKSVEILRDNLRDHPAAQAWRAIEPERVEPHGHGLIVSGTLAIRGPGGLSETEIYWTFCFRGAKISVAAGFDQRDEALRTIQTLCGSV